MKKLLLLLAGGVAAIVAISMTGPLIGFAISALLVFLGMHYYVKSSSAFSKLFYIVLGLIGVFTGISNVPGLIGLGAIVLLYVLYKKWNNEEVTLSKVNTKEEDPFTNFETEWAKLTK